MKNPKDVGLLIADDDDDLREILELEFINRGFKVFTAKNGDDALKVFKTQKIDAVISDIRMPVIDGKGLLLELRKLHATVPIVIFISGFSELEPEEAIKLGAVAVVNKPFDREFLLKTLLDAINKMPS